MKLARHGSPGQESPLASVVDGVWHDLSAITADITPGFLGSLPSAEAVQALPVVAEPGRFGAPLTGIGKIVCVGLNYSDHARETGQAIPEEPILFLKASDTVVGPEDTVLIPRKSVKTDWEVELAIVIGTEARYLGSPDQAPAHIAGFAISNDVSEREFQLERGGQWDKGKNCETFNPLGPWLVTADELDDPQALDMRLSVNGVPRQQGSTATMIFGINEVVWYISQMMVLRPGDVINTGTPPGVAMGLPDQPYLRDGDVVELSVEGLGAQRQLFRQA